MSMALDDDLWKPGIRELAFYSVNLSDVKRKWPSQRQIETNYNVYDITGIESQSSVIFDEGLDICDATLEKAIDAVAGHHREKHGLHTGVVLRANPIILEVDSFRHIVDDTLDYDLIYRPPTLDEIRYFNRLLIEQLFRK